MKLEEGLSSKSSDLVRHTNHFGQQDISSVQRTFTEMFLLKKVGGCIQPTRLQTKREILLYFKGIKQYMENKMLDKRSFKEVCSDKTKF